MDFSVIGKICIFVIIAILQLNSTEAEPVGSLPSIPAIYRISRYGVYHFRCPHGFDLAGPAMLHYKTNEKKPVCVPNMVTLNTIYRPSKFGNNWESWVDSMDDSSVYSSEEDVWVNLDNWGGNLGNRQFGHWEQQGGQFRGQQGEKIDGDQGGNIVREQGGKQVKKNGGKLGVKLHRHQEELLEGQQGEQIEGGKGGKVGGEQEGKFKKEQSDELLEQIKEEQVEKLDEQQEEHQSVENVETNEVPKIVKLEN